jgi:hypothetical protein
MTAVHKQPLARIHQGEENEWEEVKKDAYLLTRKKKEN